MAQNNDFLERLQNGDDEAWCDFFETYYPRLVRLARSKGHGPSCRESAHDVANSAMGVAFRRITDPNSPPIEYMTRFLKGVATKKCLERQRKHLAGKRDVRKEAASPEPINFTSKEQPTPDEGAAIRELCQLFFQHLSARERRILELFVKGRSTAEIATELGVGIRIVQLAIEKMRNRMEQLAAETLAGLETAG